ncbi:hypothetical protein AN639_10185 [Candidatus Epulonipiscium fishelsonii]|uniref:Uncharacterized protein n=1 Tax=Candidatus Epulonipiscium fishelsonii TaxID=77094 RepID=A0ACC8XCT1_9FIRM|nr:hypothetical protein AN396_05675 [Epulopiscium sp. SCG-B11WGA-EpuloA1]ONI43627.1 hypothetical protein AN639_10185 [Epulopiscium sp. SCG-B05WGA-EpuloA1]
MENLLKAITHQEETLIFDNFNSNTTLELGLRLVEEGKLLGEKITIDISRFNQQLFHFSFDNTSVDNDEWVRRKKNVVSHFYKSSLYIGTKLKLQNSTIEDKYCLSSKDYSPYGGAFPIILRNTGVIGVITVSGLAQIDDHNLVVKVISEYLNI